MTPFERWTLWLSAAATTVTGLGYLWPKDFMEPTDPWAVINHPLEPVALKAHILVAPVFVFILGAVVLKHAVPHLTNGAPERRATGLGILALLAPMLLSGYLIQVLTNEVAVRVMALTHIGSSLAFTAGLAWHSIRERATASAASPGLRASAPIGLSQRKATPDEGSMSRTRAASGSS
jgi:hypothetical protein